jgi:hypothetical protein
MPSPALDAPTAREPVGGQVLDQKGPRRLVVLHHENQPLLVHVDVESGARFLAPGANALARAA